MRKLARVVFLSSALWAVSASAEEATKLREEIAVPVDYQGRQIQLTGWFEKPIGAGPFLVVIALHSCAGYTYGVGALRLWVPFLQGQGYATFKLDSFTARGYSEVCATQAVTAADRAPDVLAAAALLAGRPDVKPDRIAVIGWSHGGGTAVYVARDYLELRPLRAQPAARGGRLAASIGLYPICGSPDGSPVIVPLLALSGALDDWNPAAPCVARRLCLHDACQHLPHRRGSCARPGRRLCAQFAASSDLRPARQFEKRRRSATAGTIEDRKARATSVGGREARFSAKPLAAAKFSRLRYPVDTCDAGTDQHASALGRPGDRSSEVRSVMRSYSLIDRARLFGRRSRVAKRALDVAVLVCLALSCWAAPGGAEAPSSIGVELNRLEDQAGNCRAYLVISNPGSDEFTGFALDLVVFDRGGTIMRRLAVDVAPLRPAKTTVKVFDISETPCSAIGSILVNDVIHCRDKSSDIAGCVDRLSTSSKLAVSLLK